MLKPHSKPTQRSIAIIANVIIISLKFIHSSPLEYTLNGVKKGKKTNPQEEIDFSDPWNFWPRILLLFVLLCIAAVLAGLTLGLMSLDETNLEILKKSGSPEERKHAAKIEPLRKQGHLVLCTLLLSNVVVNEALPVLMDPVIGGGWQAVLGSSALLVVFAEIIPQAIFTKHSLMIGAKLTWLVRSLMFLMYPLAYPIAYLLDRVLGESHGTAYCRAELKELVSMHDKELIPEEVRIIQSVLDLREKSAINSMTHLKDAFMLDWEDVIDKDTVERILSKGHSRVPVYYKERYNIIGMVLVKKLVSVKRGTPIRKIPLSPLLAFSSKTPLFEIMNNFQQGKSHMATVYEKNGGVEKAIGIITLEDVLEELIGGEIVDETDEYFNNEGKIKVVRHIKRNSFVKYSPSPRLHLLNHNNNVQFSSITPATIAPNAYDHSQIPQIGVSTDPSSSPQDGDLILVTAIPGKSFMGRVIDPYQDLDYLRPNTGEYGSMGQSKGPLLVVPSVNPPCADPSVHLLEYNRHPEPQYQCTLLHPHTHSIHYHSKHEPKSPKKKRCQTLPNLSTEDYSENDLTSAVSTPKTESETSPQPKVNSLPKPSFEFKPILSEDSPLLQNSNN